MFLQVHKIVLSLVQNISNLRRWQQERMMRFFRSRCFSYSASAIDTPRRTGFGHNYLRQQRESGFEFLPDPDGNVFAGGVFETGNFVEIKMVQLFPDWMEGFGDIR